MLGGSPKSARDDFPLNVKRALAGRAGNRCSVCQKSTSGPGPTKGVARSDGVAAHITAASQGGPRFDTSLSHEERRSAANGIWVCTQHGREIDAAESTYSVELLRSLKKIREESATRELQQRSNQPDQSAVLIEIPYVTTNYKLFEVIERQIYTYPTTAALRDLLRAADQPSKLLDLVPDVIIGTWESHPNVVGILSTLLSNNIDYWQPTPQVLAKLEELCDGAINGNDWTRVASVEPLAFALSAKGRRETHRTLLERLVNDTHWREADAARIRQYYGNTGVEIAAIIRHWNDPFRKGLLRVNDVARLIDLLISSDVLLRRPLINRTLLDLLSEHAKLISECGTPELAHSVKEKLIEAFKSLKHTEHLTSG